MFQPIVALAISKASCPTEAEALCPVLDAAVALDEQEQTFGERIDANKALRGEGPTKLSKGKTAQLKGLAADSKEMESDQLNVYASFESATSIVYCLHTALEGDVAFWQQAYKKTHPSDAPIVQQFAAAKALLHSAMSEYLSQFRGDQS